MEDKWMFIFFSIIFVAFLIAICVGIYFDAQVKQVEMQAIIKLSERYPEVIGTETLKEAGEIIAKVEREKRQPTTMNSQ